MVAVPGAAAAAGPPWAADRPCDVACLVAGSRPIAAVEAALAGAALAGLPAAQAALTPAAVLLQ